MLTLESRPQLSQVAVLQLGKRSRKWGATSSIARSRALPRQLEDRRADFNGAVHSLTGLMLAVRSSANSVLNGATEIRAASDDLSQRNEQQAATLEETAAAMNQVTEGVKEAARGQRGPDHHRGPSRSHRRRRRGDPRD
jgi:methyl-accepting chemotaxis protein